MESREKNSFLSVRRWNFSNGKTKTSRVALYYTFLWRVSSCGEKISLEARLSPKIKFSISGPNARAIMVEQITLPADKRYIHIYMLLDWKRRSNLRSAERKVQFVCLCTFAGRHSNSSQAQQNHI